LASVAFSCVGFAFFAKLPLRTVDLRVVDVRDTDTAPVNGAFRLGPVTWDMNAYALDPALEPLRVFFAEQCAPRAGLDAARCVSDVFAARFQHGPPADEPFARAYDPVGDFRRHMAGEPGHCVTRSALISGILLASGIPARFVQFVHPNAGHNLMEVWDRRHGWVFFDPTLGTVFSAKAGPRSAFQALVGADGEEVRVATPAKSVEIYAGLRGPEITLRYPEPWSYMRVGPRAATWPYRAVSVTVGANPWDNGRAQRAYLAATAGFALLSVGFLFAAARRASRRSWTPVRASGPLPEAAE
jgi:hypothetical protein